jgi:predicted nuclease of predicted toxin-antitoxin system
VAVRFLADESCDFAVVKALRHAGFDVLAVVEACAGATDEEVIDLSVSDGRVLITEDKDFGQLVFAANRECAGVILVRIPHPARQALPSRIVQLVEAEGDRLEGAFVVLQSRRTRITRLPD